jgi:hypothetical protein
MAFIPPLQRENELGALTVFRVKELVKRLQTELASYQTIPNRG